MNVPQNLKYTKDHEWLRVEGNEAFVGISDFAQTQLGDVVFLDVGTVGEKIDKGASFGTIEAVKTVSDIFMPISGEVLQFNSKLESNPEFVNKDPYGEGWIIKISINNKSEITELLTADDYSKLIAAVS